MTEEEGKDLARKWEAEYIETSAKTGHNIDLLFQKFIRSVPAVKVFCFFIYCCHRIIIVLTSLLLHVVGQTSSYLEGEGSRAFGRFGVRRRRSA